MPNPGPKCTGHSSQTGKPCANSPMRGMTVCHTHGGRAPQVQAAAARRAQDERARTAMVTFGLPVTIDPHDALMEEIARTAGHVRWLQAIVQEMDPGALVWGRSGTESRRTTGGPSAGDYASVSEKAGQNEWVVLYQAERTHLVAVCKAAIGAGIAERQVRIAEQQGALIAEVIRATLADLGLSEQQQERAKRIASNHLRLVSAPA